MAKIFSIINNKGGTGKTTTTMNLGAALAKLHKKILLIDLDGQCNLSSAYGIQPSEKHIGSLLVDQCQIEEATSHFDLVDVIPASPLLSDFELQLSNEPGREYLLQEKLEQIAPQYDYILIDCAPNLGVLAINSLVAATHFIVPMQTENFAFIGLNRVLQTAEKVKKRMNTNLEIGGVLLIKYSARVKFGQAVISNIKEDSRLEGKVFETTIRQDIALMESTAFTQSIFEYAPTSRGAVDYVRLANEIVEKYG